VHIGFFRSFAFARLGGNFDRTSSFRGSLIFVNLDTIALKGGQQVIDLFRRMHFRRKRIVDLIIEQIAPLFAHYDELFYCLIFLFKTYRHKVLPISTPQCRKPNLRKSKTLRRGVRTGSRTRPQSMTPHL
jgi:hypothetical protein